MAIRRQYVTVARGLCIGVAALMKAAGLRRSDYDKLNMAAYYRR